MVVLHWHEATADVLREIDGGTSIVRVPAKGNLDVVDGKGTVAERWLTDIQGIPFFTPPMLPGSIFHISLESDLLKVEKHGG